MPETDYNKPKSRKKLETEQEPDAKQEYEAKPESGTVSESVAEHETKFKTKPE